MQYNVAQLLKEPTGSTRSYRVAEIFTDSLRIADSIAGPVGMVRTHQGVLVNAELDLRTALTCSRCLGDFARSSTLRIEEEFIPTLDIHTGRRVSLPYEDEGGLQIDADHILDLTEVSRQYAIADLPMKPLCRPDCAGLCWLCGVNLNQTKCDCSTAPGGPRSGALAGLKHL